MKSLRPILIRVFLVLFIALSLQANPASAANSPPPKTTARGLGLGIVFGEPTGFSGKLWLNHEHAVDFGLSFAFSDYFLVFSDYLLHFPGGFGHSSPFISELTPYIGIGGIFAIANHDHYHKDRHFYGTSHDSLGLGVRVPLGVEWIHAGTPLGVFLELVPGMSIIPDTSGLFEGGLGIRYYF